MKIRVIKGLGQGWVNLILKIPSNKSSTRTGLEKKLNTLEEEKNKGFQWNK